MIEKNLEQKELSFEQKKQELGNEFLTDFASSQFSRGWYLAEKNEEMKVFVPLIQKCAILSEKGKLQVAINYFINSYEERRDPEKICDYFPIEYEIGHGLADIWIEEGQGVYSQLSSLFMNIREEYFEKRGVYSNKEMLLFCQRIEENFEKIGDTPDGTLEYYTLCDELDIPREIAIKERIINSLRIKVDKITSDYQFEKQITDEIRILIEEIKNKTREIEKKKNESFLMDIISLAKDVDALLNHLVEIQETDGIAKKENLPLFSYDLNQSLYREDIFNGIEK